MKKTTKITFMSVLIIALCVSLIAGATFALFTDEKSSGIDVNAGVVQLDINDEKVQLDVWSAEWSDRDGAYINDHKTLNADNRYEFTAGGFASLDSETLALDLERMVPGDGAKLTFGVTNNSNILIKYRLVISIKDNGLLDSLEISYAKDNANIELNEAEDYLYSDWFTTADADVKDLGTFSITVQLPMGTDNRAQDKSCRIDVSVFAVQINGHITDTEKLKEKEVTLNTAMVQGAVDANVDSKSLVVGNWSTYASEIGGEFKDGVLVSSNNNIRAFENESKMYVLAYGKMIASNDLTFTGGNLVYIDMSDTDFSQVTSVSNMFKNCRTLETLILANADLSNANDVNKILLGCTALKSVDFSNSDLSSVTSFGSMFSNRAELVEVNFYNANLSSLEKLTDAFINCTNLQTVDFSYANLSSVTEAGSANATVYGGGVFYGCTSLEMVTFAHATTSSSWTSMQNMFSYSGIKEFVLADMFEGCDLSGVTNMQKMFFECEQLTTVDLNHAYLPALTSMQQMFAMNDMQGTVSSLQTVDFSYADLSAVTTVQSMLLRCGALEELNFTHVNFAQVADFQKIFGTTAYIGYNDWRQIASLRTIDLSYVNLSSVTTLVENLSSSLFGVFSPCPNLEKIDLSHADLSSLTTVMNMFYGRVDSSRQYSATSLKEIDFSYADLSSLETTGTSSNSTYSMFNGCTALETVDFTGAILSNLKDTSNMFYKCSSLVTVCLWRNQDLSMLTTAKKMFGMCQKLEHIYVETEIDLSDTLTESAGMFYACFKLSNMSSNVGSSTAQYAQYAKTGDGGCFTVIER